MVTDTHDLRVTRLPGEFGPVLRCWGELSSATLDILAQEVALLAPLHHPALTIDVSGCSFLDSDGILALFQASKRLRREGQRLVVVAGPGFAARLLHHVGFDRVVPVFATEEAAVLALRGGPPLSTPATWAEARALTVLHWLSVLRALDQETPEEVLRRLTSATPLCERSDEFFRVGLAVLEDGWPVDDGSPVEGVGSDGSPASPAVSLQGLLDQPPSTRCEYCPLFADLGAAVEDLGCQSLLDPIIRTVRAGDRDLARNQIITVIQFLESLWLPPVDEPLVADAAG